MSPAIFSNDLKTYPLSPVNDSDHNSGESLEPDVKILTSGGLRIPAHASILASASPVLESIIGSPRKHRSSENTIQILGVPYDAVSAFVGFLYTSSCSEEEMEKYGIHLLALSHVYLVPQLKQRCTKALAQRLIVENVVDVLQLARLFDASDLYLRSMKLIYDKFKAVEHTEGWEFLQKHDPHLELEILQFIDEAELRKKTRKKNKEEQSLYLQLSEAMECLEHICTEGCTSVGPHDVEPSKNKGPCSKFSTCEGLQQSIKHFATCKRKVNGGCIRCRRFWQLLKLHSFICDQPDICRIPLCRQFKMKTQLENRGEDVTRWKLLAKKVMSAKVIASLSVSKRKREEEPRGGGDVGRQYRSGIYYHNQDQARLARESLEEKQKELSGKKIVTEILPAKRFYRAEEYHQQYLERWSWMPTFETISCKGMQ